MTIEKTETLIVGAGQAGLAMSEHLSNHGEEHIILERSNIAEGWRNRRWDSLVANGPAWHDRFPSMHFGGATAPDDFATKDNVADYFEDYAKFIKAPVRCGVEVISAVKKSGERGFEVETSDGRLEVKNIVAATGPFQVPVVPPIVSETESVQQLHSDAYKNPQQLSKGAVLVVGAGSSGTQIAEEIAKSGKKVYLSIGAHDRPPRSYRGRDFCWWLGCLEVGCYPIRTRKRACYHRGKRC